MVGEVSTVAESKAVDDRFTVKDRDRKHLDAGGKNGFVLKNVRGNARAARLADPVFKDIGESADNYFHRRLCGVDRNLRALHKVERAQIIQAQDVVGVGVGVENGVDMLDAVMECLVAEIRTAIDENSFFAQAKENRRTQPFVPRIAGSTYFAAAADHGNAGAGSGAENEDRGMLEGFEHLLRFASLAAIWSDDKRTVVGFYG